MRELFFFDVDRIKKEERRFARCRESTEGVDGGRVGNTNYGFDGAGVISPDDVVATIWARITHKCLLIREHTASPITLLLLSREAQPPPLVAIKVAAAPEVGHRA